MSERQLYELTNRNLLFRIREGFLQKKGETFGFWREKWFVLTTEKLACYKGSRILSYNLLIGKLNADE